MKIETKIHPNYADRFISQIIARDGRVMFEGYSEKTEAEAEDSLEKAFSLKLAYAESSGRNWDGIQGCS